MSGVNRHPRLARPRQLAPRPSVVPAVLILAMACTVAVLAALTIR